MIRISFSQPNDLDISGTPDELIRIREELLVLIQKEKGEFIVKGETGFDPEPYDEALTSLKVVVKDGPVRLKVENNGMTVEGGEKYLEKFADCFDFGNKSENEDHHHFDHEGVHEFIHPESSSLVVRVV